jgi:hypothetical protein
MPFLLVLVLGIIDFSLVFYDKLMITNASRGCKSRLYLWMLRHHILVSDDVIENAVDNYLAERLITFSGTPTWATTIDPSPEDAISPGGQVGVYVTYTHSFLAIPRFLGLGDTVTIGAKTVMRVE